MDLLWKCPVSLPCLSYGSVPTTIPRVNFQTPPYATATTTDAAIICRPQRMKFPSAYQGRPPAIDSLEAVSWTHPTFGLLLRGLQCAVLGTAPLKPAVGESMVEQGALVNDLLTESQFHPQ